MIRQLPEPGVSGWSACAAPSTTMRLALIVGVA
jgi:hypothetical protein